MRLRALGAIAATAVLVAGAAGSAGVRAGRASSPEAVTAACRAPLHAPACKVTLSYLAALDLDHGRQACRLLVPTTLEAAGGLRGCMETLSAARGIRIRYALHAVRRTPLGTLVHFTTRGKSDAPVPQAMIVTPRLRILLVVPVVP